MLSISMKYQVYPWDNGCPHQSVFFAKVPTGNFPGRKRFVRFTDLHQTMSETTNIDPKTFIYFSKQITKVAGRQLFPNGQSLCNIQSFPQCCCCYSCWYLPVMSALLLGDPVICFSSRGPEVHHGGRARGVPAWGATTFGAVSFQSVLLVNRRQWENAQTLLRDYLL